ncbi:MAG: SIS domain-containing protein [Thomasclavelia ramosa]
MYGFGTGHSHLVVDDAFWRAATPANYCALLEQSATGSLNYKSYHIENMYEIGKMIVDYHQSPNDCMIIISNSGNNIAPVDAAIRAKKRNSYYCDYCSGI